MANNKVVGVPKGMTQEQKNYVIEKYCYNCLYYTERYMFGKVSGHTTDCFHSGRYNTPSWDIDNCFASCIKVDSPEKLFRKEETREQKEQRRERLREYYYRNAEKFKGYRSKYYQENRDYYRQLRRGKNIAKARERLREFANA